MSSLGQTQGSALHGSEADIQNQENMLSRLRGAAKNRVENRENVNPKPANRTVLGALENNHRRQPVLRAAKQVGSCMACLTMKCALKAELFFLGHVYVNITNLRVWD